MIAPKTVISAADNPVTSALKVKVKAVVETELLVPLAVMELKAIGVVAVCTTGEDLGNIATVRIVVTEDFTMSLVPIVALNTVPFLIFKYVSATALPFVPILTVVIGFIWSCKETCTIRAIFIALPAYFVPALTIIAVFPAELL